MRNVKILIVVDMQNDFIDGALGTEEAQAIVPNVVNKIKNWDGNIIYTQDNHHLGYLFTAEGKKLPKEHCIEYTDGWRIKQEVLSVLVNKENAILIRKPTFGSKTLFIRLQNQVEGFGLFDLIKISEIQLIGLDTDICVISNALLAKAFFPEVPIIVDSSCCAGSTPENHKAALQIMECCQIDIINKEGIDND